MWPASHSSRSRTSSTCSAASPAQRSCSSGDGHALDALDGQALLPPRGHAAGEVAGEVAQADRAGEHGRLERVLVVAADEHDRLPGRRPARRAWSRSPARRAVMQIAPGMCASSNCSSVRTSTTSAPSCRACSTWRGVSGCASTVSFTSGPRLSATIARKFGGCGPSARRRAPDELVLVRELQQLLVGALEADRRGDLEVHPGPAAERPAEVAGPDLAWCRAASSSLSLSERKIPRAPSSLSTARSGRRDVADEQRVAGQHRPRLVAARGVDQRERRVLGPVARRVERAHDERAQLQLPAVVERLVVVLGRRLAVDVDRRAGRGGEAAVAGHVIGVVVGLEDVLDAHAQVAREPQVLVDVEPGVDDRRDARVARRRSGSSRSRGRRG